MRYLLSAFLIVLLTVSISFGFTPAPTPAAGKSLDFRYIQIAKVDVNGDAAIDVNFGTWHDINAGSTHTRWQAKPDDWTWIRFQFYFHGKDGNDPNTGQADVNGFGADTYGGAVPLFRSTILAGNEALSHDPNSGAPFRSSTQSDPNNKWANADANFVDTSDLGVFRSGTTGTTSIYGVTRYLIIATQKFYRVQISNITPAAKIDYVYCVITGGK